MEPSQFIMSCSCAYEEQESSQWYSCRIVAAAAPINNSTETPVTIHKLHKLSANFQKTCPVAYHRIQAQSHTKSSDTPQKRASRKQGA